ncbi:hypothetical protein QJS04_geneDACA018015 [Acorus gramineus]|uniref:Uncharacterized protein n=1 Tax=Acorus gramineus TaxID=55184 RepID=A0AAV9ABF1_ACOGR|nr:hypothetical protein QJS04_geneDACA018015 [Acorus gramineus]
MCLDPGHDSNSEKKFIRGVDTVSLHQALQCLEISNDELNSVKLIEQIDWALSDSDPLKYMSWSDMLRVCVSSNSDPLKNSTMVLPLKAVSEFLDVSNEPLEIQRIDTTLLVNDENWGLPDSDPLKNLNWDDMPNVGPSLLGMCN